VQGEIERSKKPALSRGRHWRIEEIDGERVLCILVRNGSARSFLAWFAVPCIGLASIGIALAITWLAEPLASHFLPLYISLLFFLGSAQNFGSELLERRRALKDDSWLHIRTDSVEQWLKGKCIWYGDWARLTLVGQSISTAGTYEFHKLGAESTKVAPLDIKAGRLLRAAADNFAPGGRGDRLSLSEFGPLSVVLDSEGRRYVRRITVARRNYAKAIAVALLLIALSSLLIFMSIDMITTWSGPSANRMSAAVAMWVLVSLMIGYAVRLVLDDYLPRDQSVKNHQLVLSQGEWSLHGDGEVIPLGREMQIKGAQVIFQRTDTGEKVVLFGKAWMPVQDSAE